MISIDLSGKNAVVTGAGKGIGKCIALTYAKAGANVWVGDIDEEGAKKTAAEIETMGRKSGYTVVDVSKLEQMQKLADAAGKIDIFAHAAGIMLTTGLLDSSEAAVRRLVDINVLGTDNAYKVALKKMIPNKSGKIVTMSSSAGRAGGPIHAHYRMSKAAIISLNQSAACTGAPYGINVNTVCPGIIRTDMWEEILDGFEKDTGITDRETLWNNYVLKSIPMGKAQTCEDIANAFLFLSSNLADSITAQAINVCGGMCMN